MRWRYAHHGSEADQSARSAKEQAFRDVWARFADAAPVFEATLAGRATADVGERMAVVLEPLGVRLGWEFGPSRTGRGHRLALTADGQGALRPLVDALVDSAPTLPSWEFVAWRPPALASDAPEVVRERTGTDPSDLRVEVALGHDGRVDLTFYGAGGEARAPDLLVLAEVLLGEEMLTHWVGGIRLLPPTRGLRRLFGQPGRPFADLPTLVQAKVREQLDRCPSVPFGRWLAQSAERTGRILELRPETSDDYPGQSDLIVAKTWRLDLWWGMRRPGFFSGRFSRHGEVFCTFKFDRSNGSEQHALTDKDTIEDALDEVLGELGCVIGGGTGLRYSYVDLALVDVDVALPRIIGRMRAGQVPQRSWILFFDVDLAGEWVGIWPDTPPPPPEPPTSSTVD